MEKIKKIFEKYQSYIVFATLLSLSLLSFLYYYDLGIHTGYGDAVSRLNISRKIIDNLTPGLAQVGNVWLPLPQLLTLPLIWNNFLWHSGIAGYVMSGISFIIGGFYIYRTALLVTQNRSASLFALAIYALNINLLYMQTTAMSESLFVSSLAAITYYSVKWSKKFNFIDLIKLAIAVNVATLTRYEGLAILLAFVPLIIFYSFLKTRHWAKAESSVIIYSTLAFLGFGLWSIYLWAIFGDPLYWKHFFADTTVIKANIYYTQAQNLSFIAATWKYLVNVIWMAGLIPTILAFFGIVAVLVSLIRKRDFSLIFLFTPFSVFLFMVLTLMRNTPINQPSLIIANLLTINTSYFNEYNIRYGLSMIPCFAIFAGFLFMYKNVFLRLFLIALFSIQLYSYVSRNYSVVFQIPVDFAHAKQNKSPEDVTWLKSHYDGGLIMVSALKHDPEMFELGLDYKNYIHEGTDKYWKASIKDPSKFATWVWFAYGNNDDQVTKYLKNSRILKTKYNLAYNVNGMRIYKIKTKPKSVINP